MSVISGVALDNIRLSTPRLVLREIEESDTDSLHSYWSDPEVTRYMPRGVVSEEGVRDLVQGLSRDEPIGRVGIFASLQP